MRNYFGRMMGVWRLLICFALLGCAERGNPHITYIYPPECLKRVECDTAHHCRIFATCPPIIRVEKK